MCGGLTAAINCPTAARIAQNAPSKTELGICGCGTADMDTHDSDGDGIWDPDDRVPLFNDYLAFGLLAAAALSLAALTSWLVWRYLRLLRWKRQVLETHGAGFDALAQDKIGYLEDQDITALPGVTPREASVLLRSVKAKRNRAGIWEIERYKL